MVHKDAGDGTDDGHGQHERDCHSRNLYRRPVSAECDKADDAEQGQEITKDADKLR